MFEGNISFYVGSFNVTKVFFDQAKPVNNPFQAISWQLYLPVLMSILLVNMKVIKMARKEEDTIINGILSMNSKVCIYVHIYSNVIGFFVDYEKKHC